MRPSAAAARALRLLLAAALLLPGCGGDGARPELREEAAARVGGAEILLRDVDELISQRISDAPPGLAARREAVRELVRRAMFAHWAKELGVRVEPQTAAALLAANATSGPTLGVVRERLLAQALEAAVLTHVTAEVEVDEAEVRRYYEDNRDAYVRPELRRIRQIVVATRREANALVRRAHGGGDFVELARAESLPFGSSEPGSELIVQRGAQETPFERVVFGTATGEVSRPVHSEFGFHVVLPLAAAVPASTVSYAEARASIRADLLRDRRALVMEKWLRRAERELEPTVIYRAGLEPADIP